MTRFFPHCVYERRPGPGGAFLFKNDLLFVYLLFNLRLTSVYPARLH